jgi:DNA invertase Pin-like site-specific DNA recombinase
MKKLTKILSLLMALTLLLSFPVAVSAAELEDAPIDESRTGSLTIYKNDMTNAEKDDVWDEYCSRNSIVVIHEFCDRAKSATTDDRPEFLKMIAASREGDFDFAIVHKLDRFSRNRYDSAYYKRELKKNGVQLLSVLEQMDDSPESIILESVLEGMSEYYSKNLAREVMKGMNPGFRILCGHIGN